jgi:hypothetical protein
VLFYFAREAAGASRARHSLRPLIFRWQEVQMQTSGASRREIANVWLRLSLRAKRSNPLLFVAPWIASLALATTISTIRLGCLKFESSAHSGVITRKGG